MYIDVISLDFDEFSSFALSLSRFVLSRTQFPFDAFRVRYTDALMLANEFQLRFPPTRTMYNISLNSKCYSTTIHNDTYIFEHTKHVATLQSVASTSALHFHLSNISNEIHSIKVHILFILCITHCQSCKKG